MEQLTIIGFHFIINIFFTRTRVYLYYTNTPYRNFELFQIELDEGCSYISVGHSKKSEEYIMLLEGILTLKVSNETYTLNLNDSISFPASNGQDYFCWRY